MTVTVISASAIVISTLLYILCVAIVISAVRFPWRSLDFLIHEMVTTIKELNTIFDKLVETLVSKGFLPPHLMVQFGPTAVSPSPVKTTQN
ncbi:hypothetical protein GIB67_014149, partial [Kingdonia uniflora]